MSTFNELVDKLNKVYISHKDNVVKVNPEYVYITIPAEYICVYNKILILFSNYGIDELHECCASCKDVNSSAINLLNMFNAAVAARKLKKDKLAETIMKYIKAKLININNREDIKVPFIIYPIDAEGEIHAAVGCTDLPEFEVDVETGILFSSGTISNDFEIINNDLTMVGYGKCK